MRALIDIISIVVIIYSAAGLGMLMDWLWPPKKPIRDYDSKRNDEN